MTTWASPLLHSGSGTAPWAAGRLRVAVAGALAVGLHALLLLPVRPTLIGSAAPDASPTMVVRLLAIDKALPSAATTPEPASEPSAAAAAEAAAPPALLRGAERRADAAATPSVAASAGLVKSAAPSTPEVSPVPPAAPGLPPAPDYFAAGRLDPGPRPLDEVNPLYPDEAKQQEGSVVLRLLINESGAVDNVAVVRAYPAGLFEASALEAFGKAKFSPGKMLGVAVKSQITIEVMFTPINRGKVSGRSY